MFPPLLLGGQPEPVHGSHLLRQRRNPRRLQMPHLQLHPADLVGRDDHLPGGRWDHLGLKWLTVKQFEGGNLAKIESAAEQTAAFALTGHHTTLKPETVSLNWSGNMQITHMLVHLRRSEHLDWVERHRAGGHVHLVRRLRSWKLHKLERRRTWFNGSSTCHPGQSSLKKYFPTLCINLFGSNANYV